MENVCQSYYLTLLPAAILSQVTAKREEAQQGESHPEYTICIHDNSLFAGILAKKG